MINTQLVLMLTVVHASAGVMRLHTNWHKTKIQNIGTGDAPRTVHIDNQAVETVSRFTLLGL